MPGPLNGAVVLDLTSYIAGPFACGLLADLGADVIKIEAPDGDMLRRFPSTLEGDSRAFLGFNRRKRSIVLDLKRQEAKDVLKKLVLEADVLVENFRPGVMQRLGLGYDILKEINPRLIYFSISGYGEKGSLSGNPGFDTVLQTFTGIAAFQGKDTNSPKIVSGSIVDYYAASLAVIGVLAALYHRERSGEAQRASTSLLATALTLQAGRFIWTDDEPREVNREISLGRIAGIHPTKEGNLFLSAHSESFWQNLCRILDLNDLGENERYDSTRKRAAYADELLPRLHTALARRTALEWETLMQGHVPCAAVREIEDMFDHPQVLEQGLVSYMQGADGKGYRGLSSSIEFEKTQVSSPTAAPALGQHTDQILME
ncbi:MAG TPA: CoA transferase, partial [Afipia sp.]